MNSYMWLNDSPVIFFSSVCKQQPAGVRQAVAVLTVVLSHAILKVNQ